MLSSHPLSKFPTLKPHLEKLRMLGYRSLEDMIYAAQAARPELEAFLGTSIDPLVSTALAGTSAASIPASARAAMTADMYALGAAVEGVPALDTVPRALSRESLPSKVSLIGALPPVLDQGSRGTCVAFSILAAYQHLLQMSGARHDLSEQFLYWNCKRHDDLPDLDATFIHIGGSRVRHQGTCTESLWPYNPAPIPGNLGQGPPPGGAVQEASSFRSPAFERLSPTGVEDVKARIAGGRVVVFSVRMFNSSFVNEWVKLTGQVSMPIPGEVSLGGHAMCAVGYEETAEEAIGGGRFLIRNSWGGRWGINSPLGTGYGTLPFDYLAKFGIEAGAFV